MFLNPWLLFGLLGVAVPIIIHLLNQRRFQRVVWAAMRFVQVSVEKNRRRMQIEDLILLALRCLAVALLAMVLARPALPHTGGWFGRQPVTAAILIDNSYSMGKSDGVRTRFEQAKKAADDILAGLPSGSSAAVFLVSDVAADVIPQPTLDLTLARQKIAQAQLCDRGTNLRVGLQRAYSMLAAAAGANKQLYMLTDGQAAGWRGREEGSQDLARLMEEYKNRIGTRVLLVSDHDTRNLLVSKIALSTELPTVDKVLRFGVEVRNEGATEARDVPVRLFIDGAETPADEAVIDLIPSRGVKNVELQSRLPSEGYHAVTARLPADSLPADDQRSMIVRVLREVQVLLVDGEPGREGRDADTFFVRKALQPIAPELRDSYFIQTHTVRAEELEQTSLSKYDAIVLANVAELSRPTVMALERVVGEGKGLIVFTGPNVNVPFYQDVLYRQHGLLPAGLGEASGDPTQGELFKTLQSGHFDHPITSLWNAEGQGNPASARFFRSHALLVDTPPATWPVSDSPPGPVAVVARYADGRPAIVEHSFGQGRVVLVGSTANTRWNDLPARGSLFVPFIHRVLDSLVHRQDEHLNLMTGEKFTQRCPGELWGKESQITRPGGVSGGTDVARVDMVDNWPTLVYGDTNIGGVYKVAIDASASGPLLFAAQLDPREGDLQELSTNEIAALSNQAAFTRLDEQSDKHDAESLGVELARPLAAVLLGMLVLETVLAFWFSRVK